MPVGLDVDRRTETDVPMYLRPGHRVYCRTVADGSCSGTLDRGSVFRNPSYRDQLTNTMIRRSTHFRIFALFAFAALLLGTSERALGRHPCPHHDRLPDSAAAQSAKAHAHHDDAPAQDHDESHGCTCVGACAQTATTALTATTTAAAALQPVVSSSVLHAQVTGFEQLAAYAIPFANPPPPIL